MAKARALIIAMVVAAFVAGYMSAPEPAYPACTDDSGASPHAVCVWDARAQGDGNGRSFVSLNSGQRIVYADGTTVR